MVIVAGRRAERNPDKNKLTIDFLFPRQNGGKEDAGEIILIKGKMPQIVVRAPEDVLAETGRRQGSGRE